MKSLNGESRKPTEVRGGRTEASPRRSRTKSHLHCSDLNWRLLVLLALLATLVPSGAQYTLDWWTTDGGGGTSTGGGFAVSGTIGQPDAGKMSGGDYSLTGGFWVIGAVPAPGAPVLSIQLTTTNTVMVCWPSPSTGFNLQVNTDLATMDWLAPVEPVQDDDTIRFIMVNPPTGNRFYRLKHP